MSRRPDLRELSPEERAALRAAALRQALAVVDRYAPPLLFLLAFAARLLAASVIRFPALDDPAYYLKVAENLAAGRGLTIDVVWAYLVDAPSVTHPSNEHWMPLASLVLAPFFALFGPSFALAQAVGAAAGAALAPLAWWLARQVLGERGAWRGYAAFAGVLVALNPLLIYQAITADSAVSFAVLGVLLALVAARPALQHNLGALLAGLLAGAAYLARSEGALLAVLLVAWIWWRTPAGARWRRSGLCAAAALAVAGPWWVRNAVTFGAPVPVPALLLASLPDYAALFHYGGPAREGFPVADAGRHVALRLEALGANAAVWLRALFPVAPLALVGAVRLWAEPATRLGVAIALALYLVSALAVPVVAIHGAFYHAAGVTVPVLALLSGYGLFVAARGLARRFAPNTATLFGQLLCGGALVLQLFQLGSALDITSEGHRAWQRSFETAAEWLRGQPEGPVLSNQPASLHYASGRPAVMLPLPDPPEVARRVAQRYGARYLVAFWGMGPFGASSQYPQALANAPGFTEVFTAEGVTAYRIE